MSDIFQEAGQAATTVEHDVAKGVAWVSHLYGSVSGKLKAFEKAEPALVSSVSELVQTGEAFLASSVPAITAEGLNLPADSAAFAALQAFLKSFESAAAALKQVIAAVK
jgi:hypothetical protein